ncbi:MAG: DUF1405 domain-containing protein [Candidatus ainarchaeum sp.]|nr:DUF1405 domain-containing protein [Candidatus ainarchaeum sp.]
MLINNLQAKFNFTKQKLIQFQSFILKNKQLLFILFFINFIFGTYSISYYFWKLPTVNPLLWFFVIDCPLYVILLSFVFLLKFFSKQNNFFQFIVIIGLIKYAFWTFFSLFLHGLLFSYNFEFLIVIVAHLFMLFESLLFFKFDKFKLNYLIFGIVWFIFNDILDYFFLLHPYFRPEFFNQIMLFSFFSSILVSFFVYFLFSKRD